MTNRVWLAAGIPFVLGALLVLGVSPWLLDRYVMAAPRQPEPSSGHIQAYNQHGTVVYLSVSEQLTCFGVAALGMVFLGVGSATYRRSRSLPGSPRL